MSAPAAAPPGVVVASFNIRCATPSDEGALSWEARKEGVMRCIAKSGADFVGLQEARAEQVQYIADQCQALGYRCLTGAFRDGKTNGEAVPILYRAAWTLLKSDTFWLSEVPLARSDCC